MSRSLLRILLIALAPCGAALAWAAENAQVELVRAQFGAGTATGESLGLEGVVAQSAGYVAAEPGSSVAFVYGGYLAPATDRAGLVTRGRIADALLGRYAPAEPVAVDFAGNRDGRIDIADLVFAVNRQLP